MVNAQQFYFFVLDRHLAVRVVIIVMNGSGMPDYGRLEYGILLVHYLAQVIYAKNCPTTFYCIFQLVWTVGSYDHHPKYHGVFL